MSGVFATNPRDAPGPGELKSRALVTWGRKACVIVHCTDEPDRHEDVVLICIPRNVDVEPA